MIRKTIPFLMIVALAAFGLVACQQAQERAEEAGAAVTEQAGEMAETAGEMAGEAGAAVSETGADMLEQAGAAAEKLGGEAKAMYDEYASKLKEKQDELAQLKERLSGMSPQDLLSGEGKELKGKADALTTEISDLKTKMQELLGGGEPS